MAHIGKNYKLQFRRDLANVRNNRDAFPEAFKWSNSNASGDVASDFLNNLVPLVNLMTDAQPPMVWTSDVRTVGSIGYHALLVISDPLDPTKFRIDFKLLQQGTGAILFGYSPPAGTPSYFPSGFNSFTSTGYQDSVHYKIVGGGFFWSLGALGWNQYNP
jgi:hypothetical protein